jgi:uncharacterized delta-60 repeat protein
VIPATTFLLALFLVALPGGIALAAPGDLDPSFDGDGRVTTDFGGNDLAEGVAIQADGKIVVAGSSGPSNARDFALTRYNADGSLDSSFDADGRVTTNFGGDDAAAAIAIQADGKIVVAGVSNSAGSVDFALARYNANGSLDSSFDADGRLTTDFLSSNDLAHDVAVQADGKIVAAGEALAGTAYNFALARYNADGSLDSSFDADGRVTTDFGSDDFASGVAIQGDAKIVVAGWSGPTNAQDFALARYNADGSLDSSFDADGRVTTTFGDADTAYDVAIQPDGKIVAAGQTVTFNPPTANDFALARYNANGSLDSTFSGDGRVTTDFSIFAPSDQAFAVAIQTDGKLLAAGTSMGDFGLARYNGDGSLDSNFSGDGLVTTDFGAGEIANGIALQTDGKIVAAGSTVSGASFEGDFALARYLTAPAADVTPPTVTCSASPSTLSQHNRKLVTVTVSVSVTDAESGPDGFELVSATSSQADSGLAKNDVPNDIQGWTTGTPDTSGLLRAERFGSTRTYTLTYRGYDLEGNSALCNATVTVPLR